MVDRIRLMLDVNEKDFDKVRPCQFTYKVKLKLNPMF